MSWHQGVLAPFDLETSGIDPWNDRIVSYCIGRVGGGQGTATRTGIVNPGIPIPAGATAVHGITDEMAQAGQLAREAVEHIAAEVVSAQLAGIPLVGWNLAYDLTMLSAEIDRYGLATLHDRLSRPLGPVLDGLVLDKHLDPYRKGSRKLVDAARHYGVPMQDGTAHGAKADALAAARVAWRIAQQHTQIADMPLQQLHDAQKVWAREQADSLRSYFERTGKQHDGVDGTWPVRQHQAVAA